MSENDPLQLQSTAEKQKARVPKLKLPTVLGIFRAIRGIQGLVALSILTAACARPPTTEGDPTKADIQEAKSEEEDTSGQTETGYSPERYPTIESRKKYLLEKYGIIVKAYDEKENRKFERENMRRFRSCEAAMKKNKHMHGVEIARVIPPKATTSKKEEAEAKERENDPMLAFLDDICRVCDTYPKSLFTIKGMEVVMAEEILAGKKKQQSAGYATLGKRMVIISSNFGSEATMSTFRHEFFHLLDQHHQDSCKDDAVWTSRMNKSRKYHGFKHGFTGAENSLDGNASEYGAMTAHEDQATMGESMTDIYELRRLLHRAKKDPILLKKMEAISACKIDPVAGRFLHTMTEDEYRAETGYDRYYYYYSWSKDMDAKYWNGLLDKNPYREHTRAVRPAGAPQKNQYDVMADDLDYESAVLDEMSGITYRAVMSYMDAHEPEIAQKLLLELEKKWKKEGGVKNPAALAYDFKKAGLPEKAQAYFVQAAKELEKKGDWGRAMLYYFEAENDVDGERMAEAFFKPYQERYDQYGDFDIENDKNDYNDSIDFNFTVGDLIKMKKMPKIARDILRKSAAEAESKGFFSHAEWDYERAGEQEKAKEMAQRRLVEVESLIQTKRWKDFYLDEAADLYQAIGQNDKARGYFLMAADEKRKKKFFEDAAKLYEKAGRIDIAIECLLENVDETKKEDQNSPYIATLYHQIADLQRKLDGK